MERMETRGEKIGSELKKLYGALDRVKRDGTYKAKLMACSYMHHRDGYEGTEVKRVRTYDSSAQNFFEIVRDGALGYIMPRDKNWCALVPASGIYGGAGEGRKLFFTDTGAIDEIENLGELLESWASSVLMMYTDSNYYEVVRVCETDAWISGTGYMMALDEFGEGLVTYRAFDPQECCVSEDEKGRLEVFIREYRLDAVALVRAYPDADLKASRERAKGYDGTHGEGTVLLEAILPRDYLNGLEVGNGKKYAHLLYSEDDGELVMESGFDEFPVCAYRFQRDNDKVAYGTGMVEQLLDYIRNLDELAKGMLQMSQRNANPPMDIPPSLEGKYSLYPGKVNVVPDMTQRPQPSVEGADLSETLVAMQDMRQALRTGMKVDMFLTVMGSQDSRKTAYEVSQLKNEATTLLSIMVDTMVNELIWPVFRRTLKILRRKRMLPMSISELRFRGRPDLRLDDSDGTFEDFIGSLRLEMNSVFVQRLNAFTQFESLSTTISLMQALQKIYPGAANNFDMNRFTRYAAYTTQVPRAVIRPLSEVEKINQQEAEMMRRQAESEARLNEAKASADLSKAVGNMQGGRMAGGMQV